MMCGSLILSTDTGPQITLNFYGLYVERAVLFAYVTITIMSEFLRSNYIVICILQKLVVMLLLCSTRGEYLEKGFVCMGA